MGNHISLWSQKGCKVVFHHCLMVTVLIKQVLFVIQYLRDYYTVSDLWNDQHVTACAQHAVVNAELSHYRVFLIMLEAKWPSIKYEACVKFWFIKIYDGGHAWSYSSLIEQCIVTVLRIMCIVLKKQQSTKTQTVIMQKTHLNRIYYSTYFIQTWPVQFEETG